MMVSRVNAEHLSKQGSKDDTIFYKGKFSTNLHVESQKHINFLQALHSKGVTLEDDAILMNKSLDRYVNYWLPLVASKGSLIDDNMINNDIQRHKRLIPPADVAWLWHCHRLAPLEYERFVRSRFGMILEACPPFVFQDVEQVKEGFTTTNNEANWTLQQWNAKFPKKPFFLQDDQTEDAPLPIADLNKVIGFDIIGSSKRQKSFLWQVSGPRFQDHLFLEEAVMRYHQFLQLKCFKDEKVMLPIVPTYQIDLMWHTHILVSLHDYHRDCIAIRGERLYHDDSLNDRTPGGTLDVAFRETCSLWKEVYGEDYTVAGGMYRGEPPLHFFEPQWESERNDWEVNQDVILAGSFSSGKGQPERLNMAWKKPTSEGAFINAQTPSFINTDPPKVGYIFGRGPAATGRGYYSLETKEAYKILWERLLKKEAFLMNQLESYDSDNCLGWCCKPSEIQLRAKKKIEDDLNNLWNMMAFVKARYLSSGPYVELSPEQIMRHYASRSKNVRSTSLEVTVLPFPYGFPYGGKTTRTTTLPTKTAVSNDGTNPGGVVVNLADFLVCSFNTVEICDAGGCGGGSTADGGGWCVGVYATA